jgi:hypothetical protein
LKEAASLMARLAREHPGLHEEFVAALRDSVSEAQRGGTAVVEAVNQSGFRVSSASEAGQYCADLLSLYLRAFDAQR